MNSAQSGVPSRPSLAQLRKQAKDLLRLCKSGDPSARALLPQSKPKLADAQHVIARQHGFESWPKLKRSFEAALGYLDRYEEIAGAIVGALSGDKAALDRLQRTFSFADPTAEKVEAKVRRRLDLPADMGITEDRARDFVARLYGFGTWAELITAVGTTTAVEAAPGEGLSHSPPFFRISRSRNEIEPSPPLNEQDWERIFSIMEDTGISTLRTSAATDAAILAATKHPHITGLRLEGSHQVTDNGLRMLGRMPHLRTLDLTGTGISDAGLSVLEQLPELREFRLLHNRRISDSGLDHLAGCEALEKVDLMGSASGDGAIAALAGMEHLRHLKTGDLVTDDGIPLLHELPVFARWRGSTGPISLMSFDAEPNYLLLRGRITDEGISKLRALDGLYALNLDDARLNISSAGVDALRDLPHLQWLGFDAKDEHMKAIAALPHLRMLMCQDTTASDRGFIDLSKSSTLEYLWGRRCYGLTGPGFRALSTMSSLRGLSVSCKNVDDESLAALPEFPALRSLMPMDFLDSGFRYVGRCFGLEELWCMYCRETGDEATSHLAGLTGLRTYYAGQTRITDRSMELLAGVRSLESLTFWNCKGVTDDGIRMLADLPNLKELSLEQMPRVTRRSLTAFAHSVRVSFEA